MIQSSSTLLMIPQIEQKNRKHELYNDVINLTKAKSPKQQLENFDLKA